MATFAEMEQLLGKAVLDPDFRKQLFEDPEAAADSICIELSEAQVGMIEQLDHDKLDWWAEGLNKLMDRGETQGFFW